MEKNNVVKTAGIIAGAVAAAGAKAAMTYGLTKLFESGKAVTFKSNGKVYQADAFEKEATEIKVSRKVRKTLPEAENLEAARLAATDVHERISNVTTAVGLSDLTVKAAIYGTHAAVKAVQAKLAEKKDEKAEETSDDDAEDQSSAKKAEKKKAEKKPSFDDKNEEDVEK